MPGMICTLSLARGAPRWRLGAHEAGPRAGRGPQAAKGAPQRLSRCLLLRLQRAQRAQRQPDGQHGLGSHGRPGLSRCRLVRCLPAGGTLAMQRSPASAGACLSMHSAAQQGQHWTWSAAQPGDCGCSKERTAWRVQGFRPDAAWPQAGTVPLPAREQPRLVGSFQVHRRAGAAPGCRAAWIPAPGGSSRWAQRGQRPRQAWPRQLPGAAGAADQGAGRLRWARTCPRAPVRTFA